MAGAVVDTVAGRVVVGATVVVVAGAWVVVEPAPPLIVAEATAGESALGAPECLANRMAVAATARATTATPAIHGVRLRRVRRALC